MSPCSAVVKGVIINEFVASNINGLVDEEKESSDWIELYNTNVEPVHLVGWSLTDDRTVPQKWLFPDVIIEGGDFLIVFASDKNRRTVGDTLHTNFKLNESGEFLALYAPDGMAASKLSPFPEMEVDNSYGIFNGAWVTFRVPTPGVANEMMAIMGFPAPDFSYDHGFYKQPFVLNISCALPQAEMYYTTDGSLPSKTNGTLYTSSLVVSKTTILRAIATGGTSSVNGMSDSKVTTRTYLFADDIVSQSNTPAGYPSNWGKYASASMPGTPIADYEMDPELMADAGYAAKVKMAFLELPVVSLVTDKDHFFSDENNELTGGIYMFTGPPTGGPGLGWERPVSFEYFFARDTVSLQVDCGIQLHGGHSRLPEKCPKHAFRLDFKPEYGPSKLYYPLFGDSEAPIINSFFLRAGFGQTWVHQNYVERNLAIYTRDIWAKQTQKRMGQLSTSGNYAHLFINGLYWGLYNPMERIEDDFCVSYLGGEKQDYDIIKVDDNGQRIYASEGTTDAWLRLITKVATASDPAVFQQIQGNNPDGTPNAAYECLLDLDNFIDYMLINFYGANTDWDNHNWVALRNKVNPGKGFKFLCWDSEHIIKTLDLNVLSKNNTNCPSYIFQQLKKNTLFYRIFSDRVQKHCFGKGSLSPVGAAETWIKQADNIDNSLYAESARWGDYRRDVHRYTTAGELYRKDTHYDPLRKMMLEEYFPKRTDVFINQLKSANLFPSVEAPSFKINGLTTLVDTINEGDQVTLTAPQGSINYTLDGTDPVSWSNDGSGIKTTAALTYSQGLAMDQSVTVKARAFHGSTWSALSERLFIVKKISGLLDRNELWADIKVGNYPNPFVGMTNFQYSTPLAVHVQLDVYDVSGRKVATILNEYQEAGDHSLQFDGSGLNPGIYVCRFVVKGAINHISVFKICKF